MHLVAHVGPEPLTFTVECGSGEQTIRWLALVCARKYGAERQHGRARHREGAHRRLGAFAPTNVRKKGTDFLFPNARIRDSLKHGGEVWVSLATQQTLGERRTPEVSVWSALAFSHSEALQEKRESARAELHRKLEEVKARMQAQMQRREENLRAHQRLMTEVNLGELGKPALQEEAVEYDTRRMKRFTMHLPPSEWPGVRRLMSEHCLLLHRTHRRYACFGQEGHYSDMSFPAFAAFCHDSGILSATHHLDIIADIFLCVVDSMSAEEEDFPYPDLLEGGEDEADRGKGHVLSLFDPDAPMYSFTREEADEVLRTFLLTRALFIKAVLHLAAVAGEAVRGWNDRRTPAEEKSKKRGDEPVAPLGDRLASDLRNMLSHPNARITAQDFGAILVERVKPRMKRLTATPLRKQIHHRDIQSVFATQVVPLHGVFMHYSHAETSDDSILAFGTISVIGFASLLRDSGILEASGSGDEAQEEALKEARKLFVSAHTDSMFGTVDFMIFADFLEGLARAAHERCPGSSIKDKISAAVSKVAQLYRPRMSHVPPRAGGEWEELPDDDDEDEEIVRAAAGAGAVPHRGK